MGLRNARTLSTAKGQVSGLKKSLGTLIGSTANSAALDKISGELDGMAHQVVIDEIAGLSPLAIINSAGSIRYYADKFGIK